MNNDPTFSDDHRRVFIGPVTVYMDGDIPTVMHGDQVVGTLSLDPPPPRTFRFSLTETTTKTLVMPLDGVKNLFPDVDWDDDSASHAGEIEDQFPSAPDGVQTYVLGFMSIDEHEVSSMQVEEL